MYAQTADITKMIASLTDNNRAAAMKYIEYLSQTQKAEAENTLRKIQSIFADNKGWRSEKEMLTDMATFRRERISKCEY